MQVRHVLLAGALAALFGVSSRAEAQQVTIRTPYRTASDSFFESTNIAFSGNWKGINFAVGAPMLATPPFGGYQPGAGLSTNFGIADKDSRINFSFNMGAGNQRSFVTQEPSVTVMNGQTGYISDSSQAPFVVGVVPVVGAFAAGPPIASPMMPQLVNPPQGTVDPRIQAMMDQQADAQAQAAAQAAGQAAAGGPVPPIPAPPRPNALAPRKPPQPQDAAPPPALDPSDAAAAELNAAEQSSAGRPAPSVAEARQMHDKQATAANEEYAALMVRAQALEEDGKPNVAKIYYQRIAKHATGDLQTQARQKLYELGVK